ncbi:PAN domain protein [Oesophagostomum dentatum]|uniref:PAN domain protein n=1 Tax=Oesophagostomum dentatum TaxID=61180 RepID=A0A0B1SJV9_OESDE|nr:PAN domain protein [Oesophagostomum dentatum]
MSACLNSFDTFGFECESVMFYPVDQECILNTEDRLDRPDLFADEVEDTVIYMDNNCAGSQCYAPYITQYIAVEGKQLENELDRIINVDVDSCQSLCTQRLSLTVNDFNCKSFMYNNQTRTCILSDERSKPLGRGTLIKTDGFTYYEKKCFACKQPLLRTTFRKQKTARFSWRKSKITLKCTKEPYKTAFMVFARKIPVTCAVRKIRDYNLLT